MVWVSANQKIPLFWFETHTKGLRMRFPKKTGEDEGRNVRESTEVDRRDQGIEQSSRQKLGETDSQEKEAEQSSQLERAGDC